MIGLASDERLTAMYEARDRDEVPAETPPTDDEIQMMYKYFHPEVADDAE